MWAYLVTHVQCMCVLIEVGPSCAMLAGPVDVGVGAPSLSMTSPLAWWRPSSPVWSVNEVENPGGMAGTVERLSFCEIVWRWIYSTHPGSGCGGGGHWHNCVPFGVVHAVVYYWHCLWTSSGLPMVGQNWMGDFEEQDGAVVGVFWHLPSSPASCSPLSTLNVHFWL